MASNLPIYLDNHATTRVDPRVVDVMVPYFTEHYGNASSKQHEFGWIGEAAVEVARDQIGRLIGAETSEVFFTSGATESINLALKGIAERYAAKGDHIITAATEHKAVLDTCKRLEMSGLRITYLNVDQYGRVLPADVEEAIADETILVTIMAANNEIGTLAPMEEIGRICRSHGVLFHSDATQAVGKIPVDVARWQVDLMSFSAHKMYGPKGVGALYVNAATQRIRVAPQIDGGGHERGMRSGTLNVPGIVGFGEAAHIAGQEMSSDTQRTRMLRDRLVETLTSQLDGLRVNGHPRDRLPNNANITFPGMRADRMMMDMKDIAVSSGSACSSSAAEPSHVLSALGLTDEEVLSSLRFGLGRFTSEEEIDFAAKRIVETVGRSEKVGSHV
jgi:cysteine desulfurase